MLAPLASPAPTPARSSPTATRPIPTAAPATTPTCTRATAPSTASRRSPSSRASSVAAQAAAVVAVMAVARLLPRRPRPLPVVVRRRLRAVVAPRSGASVVGRAGTGRPAAPLARARSQTTGIRSVCEFRDDRWDKGKGGLLNSSLFILTLHQVTLLRTEMYELYICLIAC
jgi:hypothetical protein